MAPRKSSKRIKVKTRNKNFVDQQAIDSSSRRNTTTTTPIVGKPKYDGPYTNKIGETFDDDSSQSRQQQQQQKDTTAGISATDHNMSHPPDCQCYLKRVGNLFLPPEQKIVENTGFNLDQNHNDEDTIIDKS